MAITPFTRQTMMTNEQNYQPNADEDTTLSLRGRSRSHAPSDSSRTFYSIFVSRDGREHRDEEVPVLDGLMPSDVVQAGSECPTPGPLANFNWKTGERYQRGCGRITCPPCARAVATRTVLAIERANPSHMVTLTLTGDQWQQTRAAVAEFSRRQRGSKGLTDWAMAWHAHVNPTHDGERHIHAYVRGQVDEEEIATSAYAVGFGPRIDVKAIKGGPYAYGLWPVFATKGLDAPEAQALLDEFLEANGGRLVHATSGRNRFWRDRSGRPTTLKEARKATTGEDWSVERWKAA